MELPAGRSPLSPVVVQQVNSCRTNNPVKTKSSTPGICNPTESHAWLSSSLESLCGELINHQGENEDKYVARARALVQLEAALRVNPELAAQHGEELRSVLMCLLMDLHHLKPEVCAFATHCLSVHGELLGKTVVSAALPALLTQPEPSRTESFKSILVCADQLVSEQAFRALLNFTFNLGLSGPLTCVGTCCELVLTRWSDEVLNRFADQINKALILLSNCSSELIVLSLGRSLQAARQRHGDRKASCWPIWTTTSLAITRASRPPQFKSPICRPIDEDNVAMFTQSEHQSPPRSLVLDVTPSPVAHSAQSASTERAEPQSSTGLTPMVASLSICSPFSNSRLARVLFSARATPPNLSPAKRIGSDNYLAYNSALPTTPFSQRAYRMEAASLSPGPVSPISYSSRRIAVGSVGGSKGIANPIVRWVTLMLVFTSGFIILSSVISSGRTRDTMGMRVVEPHLDPVANRAADDDFTVEDCVEMASLSATADHGPITPDEHSAAQLHLAAPPAIRFLPAPSTNVAQVILTGETSDCSVASPEDGFHLSEGMADISDDEQVVDEASLLLHLPQSLSTRAELAVPDEVVDLLACSANATIVHSPPLTAKPMEVVASRVLPTAFAPVAIGPPHCPARCPRRLGPWMNGSSSELERKTWWPVFEWQIGLPDPRPRRVAKRVSGTQARAKIAPAMPELAPRLVETSPLPRVATAVWLNSTHGRVERYCPPALSPPFSFANKFGSDRPRRRVRYFTTPLTLQSAASASVVTVEVATLHLGRPLLDFTHSTFNLPNLSPITNDSVCPGDVFSKALTIRPAVESFSVSVSVFTVLQLRNNNLVTHLLAGQVSANLLSAALMRSEPVVTRVDAGLPAIAAASSAVSEIPTATVDIVFAACDVPIWHISDEEKAVSEVDGIYGPHLVDLADASQTVAHPSGEQAIDDISPRPPTVCVPEDSFALAPAVILNQSLAIEAQPLSDGISMRMTDQSHDANIGRQREASQLADALFPQWRWDVWLRLLVGTAFSALLSLLGSLFARFSNSGRTMPEGPPVDLEGTTNATPGIPVTNDASVLRAQAINDLMPVVLFDLAGGSSRGSAKPIETPRRQSIVTPLRRSSRFLKT